MNIRKVSREEHWQRPDIRVKIVHEGRDPSKDNLGFPVKARAKGETYGWHDKDAPFLNETLIVSRVSMTLTGTIYYVKPYGEFFPDNRAITFRRSR